MLSYLLMKVFDQTMRHFQPFSFQSAWQNLLAQKGNIWRSCPNQILQSQVRTFAWNWETKARNTAKHTDTITRSAQGHQTEMDDDSQSVAQCAPNSLFNSRLVNSSELLVLSVSHLFVDAWTHNKSKLAALSYSSWSRWTLFVRIMTKSTMFFVLDRNLLWFE